MVIDAETEPAMAYTVPSPLATAVASPSGSMVTGDPGEALHDTGSAGMEFPC